MINRIEKNILSSQDYVERGQEHVKTALENQQKARKVGSLLAPVCLWAAPHQLSLTSSSPTEETIDCHLSVHHCPHSGGRHCCLIDLRASPILGEIFWPVPWPVPSPAPTYPPLRPSSHSFPCRH